MFYLEKNKRSFENHVVISKQYFKLLDKFLKIISYFCDLELIANDINT